MEATAEVIVDAAAHHPVEGQVSHDLRRGLAAAVAEAQEELVHHGLGELDVGAEASPLGVDVRGEPLEGDVEHGRRQLLVVAREARAVPQVLHELVGGGDDLAAALRVGVGRGLQHAAEAGEVAAVLGRVVGAAIEGLEVRGEEDAHGPAARAGDGHHGLHVDAVQVRALLPVNLDAHEEAVHQFRDLRVLEGLALHDVAPVARGVADAQEDRPVLAGGQLQRLRPPRVPVDGVVGVLLQVGAGLGGESVGHTSSCAPF